LDNQVELVPALRMLYLVEALQIKHFKLHPESVRIHLLQAAKRLLQDSYSSYLRLSCLSIVANKSVEDQ